MLWQVLRGLQGPNVTALEASSKWFGAPKQELLSYAPEWSDFEHKILGWFVKLCSKMTKIAAIAWNTDDWRGVVGRLDPRRDMAAPQHCRCVGRLVTVLMIYWYISR